jgi:hypothetical protein
MTNPRWCRDLFMLPAYFRRSLFARPVLETR